MEYDQTQKDMNHALAQVSWQKPAAGRFKVNTDRSFLGNNSRAGIRGVMRNELGDLVMAFSIPIQFNNNNQAEAQAAKYGVDWCFQNGIRAFDWELDSLIVTNMLKNEDTNNFKLRKIIKDITSAVTRAEVYFRHCFREANQVVNSLAKSASSSLQKHKLPSLGLIGASGMAIESSSWNLFFMKFS
ncbi:uncharacterized protein LOC142165771 [Nicotiana tabacum]|uniref:Uncharacterized protein LOC142165771 n=1 Tax=Nicotiana tabacum TaxID=4097 RepID=A0AC58S5R9_TOBAC